VLETDLKELNNQSVKLIDEDKMKAIEIEIAKHKQEWNKKKKGCMEILDLISEGMDISIKELFVPLSLIRVGAYRT